MKRMTPSPDQPSTLHTKKWPRLLLQLTSEHKATQTETHQHVTPCKPFQAANLWRFAVYKPNKKTGTASWELSYDQFAKGKPRQTIAMTQTSGKPIQLATVVGHIFDGLVQCRLVDLHRLSLADPPPTKGEWQDHERCCVDTAIDVTNYLILMIRNNYEKRF